MNYYFRLERHLTALKHAYWHAQFCTELDNVEVPQTHYSINTSTPAFPVAATNTSSLAVAAAISLYGLTIDDDIKTIIRGMKTVTAPSLRAFF